MTTHDALLAAILATPADDLPRLVYADWLEENGESERAEFIRVGIEVAKGCQCRWAGPGATACGEWNKHLPSYRIETWCEPCSRYRRNYGRMAALADGIYGPSLGTLALAGGTWVIDRGFASRVSGPLSSLIGGECRRCDGGGRVTAPNPQFTRECPACHGTGRTVGVLPALVAVEPVRLIEVTDREPWGDGRTVFSWWLFDSEAGETERMLRSCLPEEIYSWVNCFDNPSSTAGMSKQFPTRDAATAALSAALIAWAKSQPHPARIVTSPVSVDFVTG